MFGRRPPPSDALKERMRQFSERPAAQSAPAKPPRKPREPRQPMFRNGAVTYGDGHRLAVVIKDLSAHGARIEFLQNVELPDRVELSEPTLRLRRSARVIWRAPSAAGLAFDEATAL